MSGGVKKGWICCELNWAPWVAYCGSCGRRRTPDPEPEWEKLGTVKTGNGTLVIVPPYGLDEGDLTLL